MAVTTRPRNHAEREQAAAAIEAYRNRRDADPTLVASEDRTCAGPRRRFLDVRRLYAESVALAMAASDAADAGDDRFDTATRRWAPTVRDGEGRSRIQEVTALAGGLAPSELASLPYRQEIDQAQALIARLAGRPELQGDPAAFAEWTGATDALEPLVVRDEEATRNKIVAGRQLADATAEFDGAYPKFARTAQALLGEAAWTVLPRFVRREGGDASSDAGGGTL